MKEKISKLMIQRAVNLVSARAEEKRNKWCQENPFKLQTLKMTEALAIVKKDPNFGKDILQKATDRGRYDKSDYLSLVDCSPLLKAEVEKREEARKVWEAKRDSYQREQHAKGLRILDECVVLNVDGATLMNRLTTF
jgi:hypothetical protein